MVHKAKVIKKLAQNKKVSADRLICIQQAHEPQENESDDGVDVDGRSNIGLWEDVAFESELRYDDERPYRLAQVLWMHCPTSTRRRTEYVKPVNLQRASVKNIQLLVKPYKLRHDHVFARSSVTEEVSISDVISPVLLTRRGEEFQLSLANATYLEAYFTLDNYGDTSEYMADDGRRVQLPGLEQNDLGKWLCTPQH